MQTAWKDNHILLQGRAEEAPRLSHRNHDTAFWLFPLAVRRLSAINLGVVKDMVLTWVFTFPGCGLISFLMAKLFLFLF